MIKQYHICHQRHTKQANNSPSSFIPKSHPEQEFKLEIGQELQKFNIPCEGIKHLINNT